MPLVTFGEDATTVARPVRYDRVSIGFHWMTSLLLIAMFGSAWALRGAEDAGSAARLLALHRSTGVLIWLVTLSRLGWRLLVTLPPALPATVGTAQRIAAKANQAALYALLLLQPITGFLQSVWRGKPFQLFGVLFPAVAPRNKPLTHLFENVHETCAILLLALIGFHALAALFHGFIRRDGVLETMLPKRRSKTIASRSRATSTSPGGE